MSKAQLIEIIELLVALLKEVTLTAEQTKILDGVCEKMGIQGHE